MTVAEDQKRATAVVRVVVTVGTDHHPFDRLAYWVNDWLAAHPAQLPGFFMQSGSTSVAPACDSSPSVDSRRLEELFDAADVIVCHGGPATMAAAWDRELVPLVVPRVPGLGEHVDDHQVSFSRKVEELGRIRLAQTYTEFDAVLASAIRDPASLRGPISHDDVAAAVARFGTLIDELVGRPRRRRPQRLILRGLVPAPAKTAENMTSGMVASDWSREKPLEFESEIRELTDHGDQARDSGGGSESAGSFPAGGFGLLPTAEEEQG